MERLDEAHTFLHSFTNIDARKFVQMIMKRNYAEAIMEHRPNPQSLDERDIAYNCQHLVDSAFHKIEQVQNTPEQLFPLFAQLSRNKQERDEIWFDEF